MDPSDAISIIIIIALLFLSAFFSSAETALTTVNKVRMRALADNQTKNAKIVLKLVEKPTKMLSTILICNNVVNLSASSVATSYAYTLCDRMHLGERVSMAAAIATGVLTILILIFGEITPKSLATISPDKLALLYAPLVQALTILFTPIVFIINKISRGLLFILRVDLSKHNNTITEDELRTFVDVSHEEGVIESEERRMITNVVDFGDTIAKDVMIPRMDMDLVSIDLTYDELMDAFSKNKFARLPVYEETVDNIVGVINLKDFFFFHGSPDKFMLKDLVREPYFTYEYKKTSELFVEMRRNFISMALVLDEYGALTGLITMEDLIEEIVGDLRDEYDFDEEDEIQSVGEHDYIVNGSTKLDDINETLGLSLESEDYDSIAGHIINLFEHLPNEGETVTDQNAIYTVLDVDKNRIDKIHIHVNPIVNEEDEDDND